MSNLSVLIAGLVSLALAFNAAAVAAQPAASAIVDAVKQLDGMSLEDLIASTAGDVRADKVTKYGGDFAAYWQAACTSLEGKAFEAVVSNTSNGRFRATGQRARLVPTTLLGQPGSPADLIVVNAEGVEVARVQAKLGASQVIAALEDSKYVEMDFLTTQDSYNALQKAIDHDAVKSLSRGVPMKPSMQRLAEAMDSGRVWKKLPCGAPLPEREPVRAIARSHYSSRWEAASRTVVVTQDDALRGAARAARTADSLVTRDTIAAVAKTIDDATVPVAGAADDLLKTTGKTLGRIAGPVAVGVELGMSVVEISDTESRFAAAEMTQQQREVAHAKTVGGVGGSCAGGTCGATAGAAIGTAILPGFGTAVGAIVGGTGGAVAGSSAGRYAAAAGMKTIHSVGITAESTSRWVGRRTYRTYRWATSW
jgi:hypothetical protein